LLKRTPWHSMKITKCEICKKPIKVNSRMCSKHSNNYNDLKRSTKTRTEDEIIKLLKEKQR